ncbi:MAG TPA: YceI family protein [Planctomycetaceae bacterium]|jgi:polyisoprenoid-binding protein YceI
MPPISPTRICAVFFTLALTIGGAASLRADDYTLDPVHSSVSFKAQHMGISWVHGRFNTFSGNFTIDKTNPGKSSFEMTIKTDSVDSGNKQRDGHLMNADFFDAKQFADITFKSTSVKAGKEGNYEVEGDFTMHGTTKKIKLTLHGGKEADVRGTKVIGFWTDLTIKRSDYGMNKMLEGIGDDVPVSISFEGKKK